MAFCTSCGSKMEDGAKFCPACGGAVAVPAPTNAAAKSAPAATATAPSYATQSAAIQPVKGGGGGGVIKVLLIVVAIIVGLGILSAAGAIWMAHKVKNAVRVEQSGHSSRVDLPGFSATSNSDPIHVARELGVDVYPGAKALEGASSVRMGSLMVGNVQFETADPVNKVEQFYRMRFPRSQVNVSDENSATLVTTTGKGIVTITMNREGDATRIEISRTAGAERSGEQTQ